MRRIIIDTDTGSDDAVAIIMALRSDVFKVEAITVVAGNVPLDVAVNNALVSVDQAATYQVPVYKGAAKPLNRELVTAEFAHGSNGMGGIKLPKPSYDIEEESAVDAIIRIIKQFPNEIELVGIGPLTNIALAIQKDPETMKLVKGLYVMGGNGLAEGNTTEYAEFNYYNDGLAAAIVSSFDISITQLPWHTCLEGVYVRDNDIQRIEEVNSIGKFIVDINRSLIDYSIKHHNINGFIICDAGIIALMIDPSIGINYEDRGCEVIYDNEEHYGEQIVTDKDNNYHICTKMNYKRFVDLLINLVK